LSGRKGLQRGGSRVRVRAKGVTQEGRQSNGEAGRGYTGGFNT